MQHRLLNQSTQNLFNIPAQKKYFVTVWAMDVGGPTSKVSVRSSWLSVGRLQSDLFAYTSPADGLTF